MSDVLTCITAVFLLSSASAQKPAERTAIRQLCGCFEVDFKYVETFSSRSDYTMHEPYRANALELVVLEEETQDKMVLQHILVINDSVFIKHWRQDWQYQPVLQFRFMGNQTWEVESLAPGAASGQWSQQVFGVDDTPRYAGNATWFMADGKRQWTSTANAPLPRREYTKRDDYDILQRTNAHLVEDWGWIHEQDNQKLVLSGDSTYVLVEEKGRNTYRRISQERCRHAADWWKHQRKFWKYVRSAWEDWLEETGMYTVLRTVESSSIGQELNTLMEQHLTDEMVLGKKVQDILARHRIALKAEPGE